MSHRFVVAAAAALAAAGFASCVRSDDKGIAAAAQKIACVSNLRQLEIAKEQWALDNKKKAGDAVSMSDLVGKANYLKKEPKCGGGGKYTLGKVGAQPTCTVKDHALPPPKSDAKKKQKL